MVYELSKENANAIYVNVNGMLKTKAEDYLEKMNKLYKEEYPEYKIVVLPCTGSDSIDSGKKHFTLSKENPNIVYIDCGKMPWSKAEEYLTSLMKKVRKEVGDEYKIMYIQYRK